MANNGGRPPKFKTVQELEDKLDEYFNREQYYTITGLCLYLGFCDKCSFYDYEKKPEFSHAIKTARLRVESSYENHLHKQSNSGAIFALKNFGWTDKQEIDQKVETQEIKYKILPKKDNE